MSQNYQHGVFAVLEATENFSPPQTAGTLPFYIGIAPVHQLPQPPKAGEPILIRSWRDVTSLLGYSDDYSSFDLSEACYAQLRSNVQSVAPFGVLNLLDPAVHQSEEEKSASITFVGGIAVVQAPFAIYSTLKIDSKVLGTDFDASYSEDGSSLILKDLTGEMTTVDLKYKEVDITKIAAGDIVKAIQEKIPLVYQKLGQIPTVLCCPHFGAEEGVYAALTEIAASIGGHWQAFVCADIPADESASTLEAAKSKREELGMNSPLSDACWPMVKWGKRIFHLSVLTAAAMQRVDLAAGNIPSESPSNKPIDADSLCLADGTPIEFDEIAANTLNEAGIRTAVYRGGRFVLWGPHTAAYVFGKDMDPRDQFDSTVRMAQYVANSFQLRNQDRVDRVMRRSLVDTILNDFQEFLDQLQAQGATLGGTISFQEDDNPQTDMVSGDFVFSVRVASAFPAKSLTARIRCTTDGLTTLFGGEENA